MRRKVLIALAGAVLLTSGLFATDAAAAVQCRKKTVMGSSPAGPFPWTTKSSARNAARQEWTKICSFSVGGTWCGWSLARYKKEVCNLVPNNFGGYVHYCQVKATPCRNKPIF